MMSDAVLVSIISGGIALLTVATNGALAILMLKLNQKADVIHALTNSGLGLQLQLNANNSRWRADMSKKPEDIEAANQAQRLLLDHIQEQKNTDAINLEES